METATAILLSFSILITFIIMNREIKELKKEGKRIERTAIFLSDKIKEVSSREKVSSREEVKSLRKDIFFLSNPLNYKYDDIIYFHRTSDLDTHLIQGKFKGREYKNEHTVAHHGGVVNLRGRKGSSGPSYIFTIDTGYIIIEVHHSLIVDDIEEDINDVIKDGKYGMIQIDIMPDNKGECLNAELVKKIGIYNEKISKE